MGKWGSLSLAHWEAPAPQQHMQPIMEDSTRNIRKINFSAFSSSPPEAPKLLETLEYVFLRFFSQPCKIFFCIKGRLPFLKGMFFWGRNAVRFSTRPCQSRSLHSRLEFFMSPSSQRACAGWSLWYMNSAKLKWRNTAEEGWRIPPEDDSSRSEAQGQAHPRWMMSTLDWP